jgi:WD40 repeat protein
MKSGIPSGIQVHSFNERDATFSKIGSISTTDAIVDLAANAASSQIYTVVGAGCKNYSFDGRCLQSESDYEHDIRIATKQEQSRVALSADASVLAVGSDSGSVQTLSLPECTRLSRFDLHTKGVNYVDISADGSLVISIARDYTAYIWDSKTAIPLQQLHVVAPPEFKTHLRAARFSKEDHSILVTAESNPRCGAWISIWRARSPSSNPTSHATSADSKPTASADSVLTASADSVLTARYESISCRKVMRDALTSMAVHEDGRIAASSSEGHVALFRWNGYAAIEQVWSTESRQNWFKDARPPHILPVTAMCFSEHGKFVLAASADFRVTVWPARKVLRIRSVLTILAWVCALISIALGMLFSGVHGSKQWLGHLVLEFPNLL